MTICFMILHYNVIEETLGCIDSIQKLSRPKDCRLEILVVDNASPNHTGEQLRRRFGKGSGVTVLLNSRNDGFSKGNNLGYQYAREHFAPDFMVFTNNDVLFPQKNFIEKILELYEKMDYAVLGPDILHATKKVHQSPIGEKLPDKKQINRTILLNGLVLTFYPLLFPIMKKYFLKEAYEKENLLYHRESEDACIMGACMIVSKRFLRKKEKAFEPETGFYYEEYLLKLWCERNHEKMCYSPELQVLHNHGKATESEPDLRKKIHFRMKNIYDSARIYRREYLGNKKEQKTEIR